jgi:hypothetical protein
MIYPTIIVDDFFDNPKKVKNLASTLEYKKDPEGRWPGERTTFLHQINYPFFNHVHLKILSILYPNDFRKINYSASSFFQKIASKRHGNKGWVHKDVESEITAIIYLSDHENCGTSLWRNKNFFDTDTTMFEKRKLNKLWQKNSYDKKETDIINKNNSNFKKILNVDSVFNRLVLFDSNHHHSAEGFLDEKIEEDRLTLVTFIEKLNFNDRQIRYSLTECKRLDK